MISSTFKGENRCESHCSPGDYFYWDITCDTTCDGTLYDATVEATHNWCSYPCEDDEHLYWDGTCEATCPDSYIQGEFKGKNLCEYPCSGL